MIKNTLVKDINNTLKSIFFEIKEYKSTSDIGLFTGEAGIILFLQKYYQYTQSEDVFTLFETRLNNLISSLDCNNLSLSTGFSGVAWLLNYLKGEKVVSENISSIIDEIDDFIISNLDYDVDDLDYMHGLLGIAYYFLSRKKTEITDKIVLSLYQRKKETENGFYWLGRSWDENLVESKNVNLSLAHGSASVIVVISKLIKSGLSTIQEKLLSDLVYKTIQFINNRKKINDSKYYPGYCSFDNEGKLNNGYSRLSWCYGDMGIGLSFWQAGNQLENQDLKLLASNIYKNITDRRLPEEDEIRDACFCHGTAGICQMYSRMYYNTKIASFRESATFWANATLSMRKFENGAANYKAWNGNGCQKDYSLLNGIAGIGLCLLSYISEEYANWDACLLLR